MDQNERGIIDDLFDRLRRAEGQSEPRDPEAEALIARHVAAQPAAPYYMAQAIVVQQEALARAQSRVQELERQLAERGSGGFLGGLFGGQETPSPAAPARTDRDSAGPRLLSTGGRRGRLPCGCDADCARRRQRLFDRGCDLRPVIARRCGGRRAGAPTHMTPQRPRKTRPPARTRTCRRRRPAATSISAASTSSSWPQLSGRRARSASARRHSLRAAAKRDKPLAGRATLTGELSMIRIGRGALRRPVTHATLARLFGLVLACWRDRRCRPAGPLAAADDASDVQHPR